MYLVLDTEVNGADLNINAVTIRAEDLSADEITFYNSISGPSEDRYRFIDASVLPVDLETFLNNFDKYEIVGGVGDDMVDGIVPTLKSGETVSDSRYMSSYIDDTIPEALERANKATIFTNL